MVNIYIDVLRVTKSYIQKIYSAINRLSPIIRKGLKGGYHQCYYNHWKSEGGAQWKSQRKSSEVDRIQLILLVCKQNLVSN